MLRNFIIYNNTTGEILKVINTSTPHKEDMTEEEFFEKLILPSIPVNHTVIEYDDPQLDTSDSYIDVSSNTLVKRPEKPSEDYIYNPNTHSWDLDVATVTDRAYIKRNELLAETDWYIIRSFETGAVIPPVVVEYRQSLRNIDQQTGFPTNITWPILVLE